MEKINLAITNLKTSLESRLSDYNDLIRIANINKESINSNTTTDIIIPNTQSSNILNIIDLNTDIVNTVGKLSDTMLKYGKDLLSIADQADRFICVSTDSYSRIIDIYVMFNSSNTKLITLFDNIISEQTDINNYLTSILNITEDSVAAAAQIEINRLSNILYNSIDLYNNYFTGLIDITLSSLEIIEVIKNTIVVNTIVGIALSVSEKAWKELKLMNQLNYSVVNAPEVIESDNDSVLTLISSPLYPSSGLPLMSEKIERYIPRIILNSGNYKSDNKQYKILNTPDKETKFLNVDDSFLTWDLETRKAAIIKYPLLRYNEILEDVAVTKLLDLNESVITEYYNNHTLISNLTLHEFIALFSSSEFIKAKEYFNYNGQLPDCILEYNKITDSKLNKTKLESILKFSGISYDISDNDRIGSTYNNQYNIFGTSYASNDSKLTEDMFNFFNSQRINIKLTSDYTNELNLLTSYLDILHLNSEVISTSKSGVIKIIEYDLSFNMKKYITSYKYSYRHYHDEFNSYYIEGKINDDSFTIYDDILSISYKENKLIENGDESISETTSEISETLRLSGYFSSNTYTDIIIEKGVYDIVSNTIKEDKVQGTKTVIDHTNRSIFDGTNYLIYTTDKTAEKITTYISDNTVERLTTNISNIYREKIISGELDFSLARTKSILLSLQYLGYRKQLDAFIKDTWVAKIPRLNR